MNICAKIRRKLLKLRLQPIRVFCFHHVSDEYDPLTMWECDWTPTELFKSNIKNLKKQGYNFISLSEAQEKLRRDWFRSKKYAVLTFDDGYASLKEILPWLEGKKIPVALFINGKYLDGKSYRKNPKEKYLTKEELFALTSPLIEVGNHGWEHTRVTEMTDEEFRTSMEQNVELLSTHPNYVPFWAYTYGTHTIGTDGHLQDKHLIPVYVNGGMNYNDKSCINRELLK